MKKFIFILVSLFLGLIINGCSSKLESSPQLAFQGFVKIEKVDEDGNIVDKNKKLSFILVHMIVFSIDKNGNYKLQSAPKIMITKNTSASISMYDEQSDEGVKIDVENIKDKIMNLKTFIAYKTNVNEKSRHLNFDFKQAIEFSNSIEMFRYKPKSWKNIKFIKLNNKRIQKIYKKK